MSADVVALFALPRIKPSSTEALNNAPVFPLCKTFNSSS